MLASKQLILAVVSVAEETSRTSQLGLGATAARPRLIFAIVSIAVTVVFGNFPVFALASFAIRLPYVRSNGPAVAVRVIDTIVGIFLVLEVLSTVEVFALPDLRYLSSTLEPVYLMLGTAVALGAAVAAATLAKGATRPHVRAIAVAASAAAILYATAGFTPDAVRPWIEAVAVLFVPTVLLATWPVIVSGNGPANRSVERP